MSTPGMPDFSGKIIAVWLQNRNGEVTNILQNCYLEQQADRFFLVGDTVKNPAVDLPFAGLKNAVAWDQIAEYIILDSVEDLYQRLNVRPSKKGWFG